MASRKVSVKGFVAASKGYVKAAVERANANKNPYLTKEEAAKLPKDLQDNFESFRSRRSSSKVVAAGRFVEDQAAHVTAAARRADSNGDGVLSAAELRRLPKDLQDNAANFARIKRPVASEKVKDLRLPLAPATVAVVRRAFAEYVQTELAARRPSDLEAGEFEYQNSDWAELVNEFGGSGEHEKLKAEALKMARKWSPDQAGWELNESASSSIEERSFVGHFKFITLFVELRKGSEPSFQSEVD